MYSMIGILSINNSSRIKSQGLESLMQANIG